YVVIPTTGLTTFEQPLTLVARHHFIVETLLGPAVVQVVIDDLVTERRASHRPAVERVDRLPQRGRKALRVRLVRVPLERGRYGQRVLDPVQPGRDQRREREVGVHVAAGDPRLDTLRGAVADDAEAARAVVVTPRERRRRPASRCVALI